MVDAFATVADLELRLNRQFSVGERPWITSLLEDASSYLREDVMGQQVFPPATSTFLAWPDDSGAVVLPQQPVASVTAVTVAGVAVSYTWRDDRVETGQSERVAVTFTYGYTVAPDGLNRWACVLVSQVLGLLENQLGLSVGGLSSVAIDDFRVAFADAGEETGITLSDRNIALIRRQYSTGGVHVTDSRA